jgi:hypothetical protein
VCVVGEKSSCKSGRVVYLLAVTRSGHDGWLSYLWKDVISLWEGARDS